MIDDVRSLAVVPSEQGYQYTPEEEAALQRQALVEDLARQQQGDPFAVRPAKTIDERVMHRMITVRLPTRPEEQETLWITESAFIEQFSLLNITANEQRGLIRQYNQIEDLAQGEGNREIVKSKQRKLAAKIVSYKSRGDSPLLGYTERSAWFTEKRQTEQSVKIPTTTDDKQGFLASFRGKK